MMDGVILLDVSMVMTPVQYAPRQVSKRGNRPQTKLSFETCSCVCALVSSFSNFEVLESRNGEDPSFGLFEYQIKLSFLQNLLETQKRRNFVDDLQSLHTYG